VTGHDEAGPLLDATAGTLEQAVRKRRNRSARFAPNVIVVMTRELVTDSAITQRHLRDDPALFEPPDGTKHRRVISRNARRKKPRVEVLDRPVMSFVALEQVANRVPNVTWPRHRGLD